MGFNATFNNISVMGGWGGRITKLVTNSTFLLHVYYDKTVYYCTVWLTILDLEGSL